MIFTSWPKNGAGRSRAELAPGIMKLPAKVPLLAVKLVIFVEFGFVSAPVGVAVLVNPVVLGLAMRNV